MSLDKSRSARRNSCRKSQELSTRSKHVETLFTSGYLSPCPDSPVKKNHLPVDFDEISKDPRFRDDLSVSIHVTGGDLKKGEELLGGWSRSPKRYDPPGRRHEGPSSPVATKVSTTRTHPGFLTRQRKPTKMRVERGLASDVNDTPENPFVVATAPMERLQTRNATREISPRDPSRIPISPNRVRRTEKKSLGCATNESTIIQGCRQLSPGKSRSSDCRSPRRSPPLVAKHEMSLSEHFRVVNRDPSMTLSKRCPFEDKDVDCMTEFDFQQHQYGRSEFREANKITRAVTELEKSKENSRVTAIKCMPKTDLLVLSEDSTSATEESETESDRVEDQAPLIPLSRKEKSDRDQAKVKMRTHILGKFTSTAETREIVHEEIEGEISETNHSSPGSITVSAEELQRRIHNNASRERLENSTRRRKSTMFRGETSFGYERVASVRSSAGFGKSGSMRRRSASATCQSPRRWT